VLWALAPLAVLGLGCHPTCREVCVKLLDCEEVASARVSLAECRDSCQREEQLYTDWEDEQALDQIYDERTCIMDESCADVADGACYDEDLFLF
jgi:hypothetical protein